MIVWTTIFSDLRAAIAQKAAPYRGTVNALLCLVYHRIGRIQLRLERLIAHWRAGTLPKPRKPRPGRARKPTERPKFLTSRAWLAVHGCEIRGYAAQLDRLLTTDPEWAEFLKAVPQAGRILRPLCHMLAIDPPAEIRRDAKPRPPRDPIPKPAPFRVPIPTGARAWIPRRRRVSAA
jgi:hypothetical protein